MDVESAVFPFRRPSALVLAGGGALGAWQAGFVESLTRRGVTFDKVIGFSAGSLTGAAYCLDQRRELLDYWTDVDRLRVLRFKPRLKPFSLFSDEPLLEVTRGARDEEAAKRRLRCEFVVMSLRVADKTTVYSRFTPGGADGWDGPLARRIAASCTIPWVFPPVRIEENGVPHYYVDGGVPGREWMRLDGLADCKDVLCVEMVRPEQMGVRRWTPIARFDQTAREVCREHITRGIESLRGSANRTRVFRAFPSRALEFSMIAFKTRHCLPALELGLADGESFLRGPQAFSVFEGETAAKKPIPESFPASGASPAPSPA